MATDQSFIDYITDQIKDAGIIRYRKMFGEYALYCNNKVVALVCNNQLYVKPTKEGKNFIGETIEAPPYRGAKPYYLVEEKLENSKWLSDLIRFTEKELPLPKLKSKKKK